MYIILYVKVSWNIFVNSRNQSKRTKVDIQIYRYIDSNMFIILLIFSFDFLKIYF